MSVEREITDERYQIEARVGSGAMATVYRAYDQRLQRIVALKILHEHLSSDTDLRRRFEQEAKLAARIDHPNVVRIYDIGINNQGQLFIVSEFIDGKSLTLALRQYMNRSNPFLNPVLAALVGHEIARGMNAAHSHSVVHRDLKPDNVLVSQHGDVKLTDFGVARPFDSSMTQAGQFIGSLIYASPEQISGARIDARSDIFSFGVILFELLTGQLPFRSTNPTDLAIKITQAQVPPLNQIRTSIPLDLDSIVRKCLRADPAERPQSAEHLVRDLANFLMRNEVQISPRMIHEGFENPNLFSSTIRRSPLENTSPIEPLQIDLQNTGTVELVNHSHSVPISTTDSIQPQVNEATPPQPILAIQQPPVAATPNKTLAVHRERARIPVPPQRRPRPTSNSSGFLINALIIMTVFVVSLVLFIKYRESLRDFLPSGHESKTSEQNQNRENSVAPNVAENPNPSATARLSETAPPVVTHRPEPVRTAQSAATQRPEPARTVQPAANKTASPPLPQKTKVPAPVAKPTRNTVKPKPTPTPPLKVAQVKPTRPSLAVKSTQPPRNTTTNVKLSSLRLVTNPGERGFTLTRPNGEVEFQGLSFKTNQARPFESLKPGTLILKIKPESLTDSLRIEGREERINLVAGKQTSISVNLRTLSKVSIRCPANVRILKVNGREVTHRGGLLTIETPLKDFIQIEALTESERRIFSRTEVLEGGQSIECPSETRRDR